MVRRIERIDCHWTCQATVSVTLRTRGATSYASVSSQVLIASAACSGALTKMVGLVSISTDGADHLADNGVPLTSIAVLAAVHVNTFASVVDASPNSDNSSRQVLACHTLTSDIITSVTVDIAQNTVKRVLNLVEVLESPTGRKTSIITIRFVARCAFHACSHVVANSASRDDVEAVDNTLAVLIWNESSQALSTSSSSTCFTIRSTWNTSIVDWSIVLRTAVQASTSWSVILDQRVEVFTSSHT